MQGAYSKSTNAYAGINLKLAATLGGSSEVFKKTTLRRDLQSLHLVRFLFPVGIIVDVFDHTNRISNNRVYQAAVGVFLFTAFQTFVAHCLI